MPYILQVLSKADFIDRVVNFDTDSLTNAVIRTVEEVFRMADNVTADTVTRASKACGPLYLVRTVQLLWTISSYPHHVKRRAIHRVGSGQEDANGTFSFLFYGGWLRA